MFCSVAAPQAARRLGAWLSPFAFVSVGFGFRGRRWRLRFWAAVAGVASVPRASGPRSSLHVCAASSAVVVAWSRAVCVSFAARGFTGTGPVVAPMRCQRVASKLRFARLGGSSHHTSAWGAVFLVSGAAGKSGHATVLALPARAAAGSLMGARRATLVALAQPATAAVPGGRGSRGHP